MPVIRCRFRRVVSGALGALLLVAFLAWSVAADVIHLRSGQVVKGRPLEAESTDTHCVIEDAVTGNVRIFEWKVIDPGDRTRLQRAWGRLPPTIEPVHGHIVLVSLVGGFRDEIHGLVVQRSETEFRILSFGEQIDLEPARVLEVRATTLDPRVIWSPAQLVRARIHGLPHSLVDEQGVPTSRGHLQVALYAEALEAYDAAYVHYRHAAQDDQAPHHRLARQKAAEMRTLRRESEALARLRRVAMAIQVRLFAQARDHLRAVRLAHPAPSPVLASRIGAMEERLDAERASFFAREVGRLLPKAARTLIEARAAEEDRPLAGVPAWARRELPDAVFAGVVEGLRRHDELTPQEVRVFWEQRPRGPWRTAGYGAGSFIVMPPRLRPPPGPRKQQPPRPPAREAWWAAAGPEGRADWLWAFFVEHSELFELSDAQTPICSRCHGTGLESMRMRDGRIMSFLCRRCGGAQVDRTIRYR